MRYLTILVCSLLLAGCVSAPMPVPADYHGPLVRIGDTSTDVSSTKVRFFQLAKVDGRTVETSSVATFRANYGRGFAMDPPVLSREVPATACVLSIEGVTHVAADILAFGGGMYHVDGDVTITLEPGKAYYVKGTLDKNYYAVWLEDADGHIVSNKVEKGTKP